MQHPALKRNASALFGLRMIAFSIKRRPVVGVTAVEAEGAGGNRRHVGVLAIQRQRLARQFGHIGDQRIVAVSETPGPPISNRTSIGWGSARA